MLKICFLHFFNEHLLHRGVDLLQALDSLLGLGLLGSVFGHFGLKLAYFGIFLAVFALLRRSLCLCCGCSLLCFAFFKLSCDFFQIALKFSDLFLEDLDLRLLVGVDGTVDCHRQIVFSGQYFLFLLHELLLQVLNLRRHDVIHSLLFQIKSTFGLHSLLHDPILRLVGKTLQNQSEQVLIQDSTFELKKLLRVRQVYLLQRFDVNRR